MTDSQQPAATLGDLPPTDPASPDGKVVSYFRSEGRNIAVALVAAASVLWGIWATHTLLDLKNAARPLVRVQLPELLREFVQTEARSGEGADQITARTTQFLKTVNAVVAVHARGHVVLLSNAVVDGDIPDITGDVRAEVYRKVPMPQAGTPAVAPPLFAPAPGAAPDAARAAPATGGGGDGTQK